MKPSGQINRTLHISSAFDAGAIEVVDARIPSDVQLRLRADNAAPLRQWFYFRVQGVAGQACRFRVLNAAEAAYPLGWPDYQVVASYDRQHWFRLPETHYDGRQLQFAHTPDHDEVYYAYFEPYPWERHLDLLGRVNRAPHGRVLHLGSTPDGHDLDLVQVGEPAPGKQAVWIIARQHPGETMAEWWMEGLLERVLDRADPLGRALLEHACLYLVPNMNPDGAVRGNLRTNALGVNLNRAWMQPSQESSPEVWLVRQAMHDTGVDLFLDIHGDETIPHVFVDGNGMIPGYPAAVLARERLFVQRLLAATPDFQEEHGYAPDRFSDELLTLASKYVAHAFGCVALTLEMPFKDHAANPDPRHGWSGQRSKQLGAACLLPIWQHVRDGRSPSI